MNFQCIHSLLIKKAKFFVKIKIAFKELDILISKFSKKIAQDPSQHLGKLKL